MRIAALFVVFTMLLLGVGAWLLADSQSKDREQLQTRFANGAGVASAVLDGLFGSITQQTEILGKQFGGDVAPGALDAYVVQNQSAYAIVLDGSGKAVAASGGAPATPQSDAAKEARTTGFAISDLLDNDGQQVVESVIRFPITPDGKRFRYLVSGSKAELFRGFLSGSIQPLVQYGGDAYILDGKGAVLGAVSKMDPKHPAPPGRELIARVGRSDRGTYGSGDSEQFFASRPVARSNWHVAVTVPTKELYQPASGVSRWLPWVVLAILGLSLIAIGLLVRRAVVAGARIAEINSQLEASQDRLRDRAVELQASNAELQRSNAELEQFAYVASHDLSAPLRAVAGFSQLLGVRYKGRLDDDADQFIRHMQDGVDRMQRIIDDLLAYSRVDRSGLHPENIDLDKILDEVLQSLRPDIEERGATVTRDTLGTACGEPGQLSQVLQNVIANGLKFTAPGVPPAVHVSAERGEGRVRISIRDNGIGIDPGHIEQIFKMFQRLHSTDEYEGTGIGLAIAKKIIDRHDGRISIAPAPGGGTIFSFDIPAKMPR
jgi:signal transduction histidine kinase